MKNPSLLQIQTLFGDWCDKDIVMLYTCFQLLQDCIEKENLLSFYCDPEDEVRINAMAEIQKLSTWWKERQQAVEKGLDELRNPQYAVDNEMLIRLINVRQYLWT